MRMAAAALSALVLLAGPAPAQPEDRLAGPLPLFFPRWDDYLALPEADRSHFTLTYRVTAANGAAPDDIRMWYRFENETIEFDFDATGRIGNPPSAAMLEAAPDVHINQAEGSLSLSMSFEARLPLAMEYDRDDLRRTTAQANAAVNRTAGVAALFAPDYKTLVFVFDGPAPEAWSVDETGERAALTVQENRVFYRPADRANRRVERILFGRAPRHILLDS